jgi:hypothetical protein
MDAEPEVAFVDEHGNLLVAPPSTDPSVRQDVEDSAGRRLTYPVPEGATQVRIFLPRDS